MECVVLANPTLYSFQYIALHTVYHTCVRCHLNTSQIQEIIRGKMASKKLIVSQLTGTTEGYPYKAALQSVLGKQEGI